MGYKYVAVFDGFVTKIFDHLRRLCFDTNNQIISTKNFRQYQLRISSTMIKTLLENHTFYDVDLIFNIIRDRFSSRTADSERAVTFLPFKRFVKFLAHPFRRIRLDKTHRIRRADCRRQRCENMSVIVYPADLYRFAPNSLTEPPR